MPPSGSRKTSITRLGVVRLDDETLDEEKLGLSIGTRAAGVDVGLAGTLGSLTSGVDGTTAGSPSAAMVASKHWWADQAADELEGVDGLVWSPSVCPASVLTMLRSVTRPRRAKGRKTAGELSAAVLGDDSQITTPSADIARSVRSHRIDVNFSAGISSRAAAANSRSIWAISRLVC